MAIIKLIGSTQEFIFFTIYRFRKTDGSVQKLIVLAEVLWAAHKLNCQPSHIPDLFPVPQILRHKLRYSNPGRQERRREEGGGILEMLNGFNINLLSTFD